MWTPISEGGGPPPKIDTNVLVTIKDDSGDSINYYTSVGWYYNGIWVVDNTVCHRPNMTEWQKLEMKLKTGEKEDVE